MHDFHLADVIFKIILEEAKNNGLKKVTKAWIELGSIVEHGEEVLPSNLAFNIKMLAQNSLADGLEVDVKKVQGDKWVLKDLEGEK